MSTNVSLSMPAIYVYVACCRLYYFYVSLIYGEYLANVHFRMLSFRALPFIPQKKSASNFPQITPWQLPAFSVPQNTPSPLLKVVPRTFSGSTSNAAPRSPRLDSLPANVRLCDSVLPIVSKRRLKTCLFPPYYYCHYYFIYIDWRTWDRKVEM